jgi:DNA-binding NarL/FixJ family response regulator
MLVLVVADDRGNAEAIGRALRFAPPLRALGYISTRQAGTMLVERARPDVVVIDEPAPGEDITRLVQAVRTAVPDARLLLLTDDLSETRLASATSAGLDAAIARTAPPQSIGLLIREVAAGRIYHSFRRPSAARPDGAPAGDLTSREMQILRLVAAGLSNGRIAELLFVTEQTVKFHLSNVYRKLGIANRTQASHYAHVHGLLEAGARDHGPPPVAVAA